jgi:hypothetical protein
MKLPVTHPLVASPVFGSGILLDAYPPFMREGNSGYIINCRFWEEQIVYFPSTAD